MVSIKLSALKESRPHEFVVRFVFGGGCTVLAGLIAKRFGPGVGGLFLAFPAIFPAGASLIESHEKRKKREAGMEGTNRGREAASLDAVGASLGAVGLGAFAVVVWLCVEEHNAIWVIAAATAAWAVLSVGLWMIHRLRVFHRHHLRGRRQRSETH